MLGELAVDLRWTWSHAGDRLWRTVAPQIWEATRNPWLILQSASDASLARLAADDEFRRELEVIAQDRRRYLEGPATSPLGQTAAYFSMEFGLGEAVPLYAGGLGVLAGDYLKAASDLGVPLVGVGLLYQEGYFRQRLDDHGRQEAIYPYNDPTSLPLQQVSAGGGGLLSVPIELPGRTVWLRVWRALVGRVVLYLLDSNDPLNTPADRGITGKLYGDGTETRLRQELVLGIGGWRVLEALGVEPGACHLNEGHAAFVVLERARSLVRSAGMSFATALWATRPGNVFTTHTPVEAGFDAFDSSLLAKYFPEGRGYLAELGLPFAELLALGQSGAQGSGEPFRPAYLALRGSGRVNGVSRLHGETSRRLFAPLFPRWPLDEVPVSHVTNGVHVPSWDSRWTDELWTSACGKERWRGGGDGLEAAVAALSDETLWRARGLARAELVTQARERLARQMAQRGAPPEQVEGADRILDPDALTLGFARRFAEYKRPNLLLRDPARLRRLLTDGRRPAQLLIAGKAHPDDAAGRALIEAWAHFISDPEIRRRVVFLEDYDLHVAQHLVQGVDVWINTPRTPWEACGTSGMKVLVNGGLNLSVLDGWWAEAYSPEVGWAIDARDDDRDAEALYSLLEREVAPTFYDRDAGGLPRRWLERVRASMSRLTARFSANRMLGQYLTDVYRPAEDELRRRQADGAVVARRLQEWAGRVSRHWPAVRWGQLETRAEGASVVVLVELYPGDLTPEDFRVELYAAADQASGPVRLPMLDAGPLPGSRRGRLFRAELSQGRAPSDYTPRAIPAQAGASVPLELPLVSWHH